MFDHWSSHNVLSSYNPAHIFIQIWLIFPRSINLRNSCHYSIIVLRTISAYHIRRNYIFWFQLYLVSRTRCVYIRHCHSYQALIASGVIQGSIISSFHFIILINATFQLISVDQAFTHTNNFNIIFPYNVESFSLIGKSN